MAFAAYAGVGTPVIPPELLALLSGLSGALVGAGSSVFVSRSKPRADRQTGDASQIQALLASATYWEAQAKRFKTEADTWQQEASDWHERFYRGLMDVRVMGQTSQTIHDLAQQNQIEKGPTR